MAYCDFCKMSTPDESGWRDTYCSFCGKFLKSGVEEHQNGSSSDYGSTYGSTYSDAYQQDYGSSYSSGYSAPDYNSSNLTSYTPSSYGSSSYKSAGAKKKGKGGTIVLLIMLGIIFVGVGGTAGAFLYLGLLIAYALRNFLGIIFQIASVILGGYIGGLPGAIIGGIIGVCVFSGLDKK